MKVFADTAYFIAILNPLDQLAQSAVAARQQLGDASLATTDEVLAEFLNTICEAGPSVRVRAYEMVLKVLSSPKIRVVEQSHDSFSRGLQVYARRRDKDDSLTDCISMSTMRQLRVREILIHDHHFRQEGFTVLL